MKHQFSITKKGISLMELLIVMSIIGIIVAITIPTMNNYLPSLKLSSSAKAVNGKMRQAQEEALTTQIRHGIKFNPTTNPVTIDLIKVESTETTLETVTLSNGVTLTENGIVNNRVIFSSDGGLANGSSPGSVGVNLGTVSKTISVSAAGMIKLQ